MGLFSRIWDAITGWVKDFVNWCIQGLVNIIEDLRKAILNFKHQLKKFISSLLKSTLGCIAVLLTVIAVAVGAVFFGQEIAASKFGMFIAGAVAKMKKSVSIVAEAIKFKVLLDVNKVLMAVWEDYRNIFADLNTAFAGLSEELGYDMSTVLLMTNLAKSVAVNSLQLFGVSSIAAELDAMTKTQERMATVESHFKSYAADPGKFIDDFDREILQPYRRDQDSAVGSVYSFLDDVRKEVDTKAQLITQIRTDLQGLQESMGPEIALLFDERLGPYLDKFDGFWYDNFIPALDSVNAGFETINMMQERNNRKWDVIEASQNDPIKMINKLTIMGEDDQRTFFRTTWEGLAFSVDESKPELLQLNRLVNGGLAKIRDANKYVPRPLPFLELEDLRPVKPPGAETYPGDGWNMGDY